MKKHRNTPQKKQQTTRPIDPRKNPQPGYPEQNPSTKKEVNIIPPNQRPR